MESRKILLAEDDSDDREFFYNFLRERNDISILPIALDGVQVFEYLNKNRTEFSLLPDVIILDQNMPRKNGLQTLELLKNTAEFLHIPVVIYSTYANDFLIQKSMEMGAAKVFTKPQDREGYNKMIDDLFVMFLNVSVAHR